MPLPRKRQISLTDTPFYHCVSRCVRRAFLCGRDKVTGKSFEHRRQWVEDRLLRLGSIFTIDICAYAVMSNHTHIVLHVDKAQAMALSDLEVVKRWQQLHKSTLLAQQFVNQGPDTLSDAQQLTLSSTIEVYRQRLFDISWFMRELNEYIARQANTEDDCTGHFWEGRFKSQALLDEHALAACMVYVDLNPIRANMASTPDKSLHTSIALRIKDARKGSQPSALMPFVGNPKRFQPKGLAFALPDYLHLVDTMGRLHSPKIRGSMDCQTNPILLRLGLDTKAWEVLSLCFETHLSVTTQSIETIGSYKRHSHRKRIAGTRFISR